MIQVSNPIYDKNSHILTIDESQYEGNDDMLYILQRLKDALSDNEVQHFMNVEDEYYRAIQKRES